MLFLIFFWFTTVQSFLCSYCYKCITWIHMNIDVISTIWRNLSLRTARTRKINNHISSSVTAVVVIHRMGSIGSNPLVRLLTNPLLYIHVMAWRLDISWNCIWQWQTLFPTLVLKWTRSNTSQMFFPLFQLWIGLDRTVSGIKWSKETESFFTANPSFWSPFPFNIWPSRIRFESPWRFLLHLLDRVHV